MKKLVSLSLALLLSLALVPATSATAQAQEITGELTGNVGFNSQYIFRGAVENEDGAVQGGLDYSHPSGFYAGYWASSLGANAYNTSGATENDFYLGVAGKAGPLSYDVGALQYVYHNDQPGAGATNDANEVYGSLGFGPVSAGLTYTTKDAAWTDSGDMFATVSASQELIGDLSADGLVRYTSLDADNANDGLAQIEAGISHPIGDSGADMSLRYIANDTENGDAGGDNQIVIGATYGFGIAE